MGLFYNAMIKEINNEFVLSGEDDLVEFLKKNEKRFMDEYEQGELMFYLNVTELLRRQMISSEYFNKKFKDAHDEDMKFSTLFDQE